ncbi:MAG: HEAT repeat domain-containing protein, partial [Phycisphaerae bacterium]|nr:HEAT repeat domain-containing protein [Phycisphaerae bacterium]
PPSKEVLVQIRLMGRDPDERVRRKLVVVLRDLQEKEDIPRVLSMLKHERSPTVLEEIYKALGRMGGEEAISACIRGLANTNANVAAGAADALGRLCRKSTSSTSATYYSNNVVTALLKKAAQPLDETNLRGQVIGAMAEIADPKFLSVLIEHAKPSEKVPQIRQAALVGIGQIGDPAQIDLVVTRLAEDTDPGVREAAAQALGQLGSQPAHLRPLMPCLAETSGTVTIRAWEAYRKIFARLSWAERQQTVENWSGDDKAVLSRRIDLLTDLESQAALQKGEVAQLVTIREQLGDSYMVNADYALAAGAYLRAIETATAQQAPRKIGINGKLLDAYLHMPAYEKATTLAANAQSTEMIEMLANSLLDHATSLAKVDGPSAAECVTKFKQSAPHLFKASCHEKLEALLEKTTPPSATMPAF